MLKKNGGGKNTHSVLEVFLSVPIKESYIRNYSKNKSDPPRLLISYFSASGKALLSGPKILLGRRTDSRTDVRPATCNI